jgi:HAD superfamily hydrolase (TIGR01509 family)
MILLFAGMPVKNVRALIFDCDGVMFDSRQSNISYYNHLLEHFDLPPMTKEQVAFVHSHAAPDSIRYIFEGTPFFEKAIAYAKEVDYSPFIGKMILEPGLVDLLRELKPRLGLAVATNRSTTIQSVLKSFGLAPYFDIVVSSLDVKNPKPDPESLFKILKFFGIAPVEAVYVGDSVVDSQTAHAAAVPFVAYKNGQLKAHYHVDRMMDIAALLDGR